MATEACDAVRLTFAWDEVGVRLVRRTALRKRLPPARPADDAGVAPAPTDLRVELLAADGRVIHGRDVPEAIPDTVEVFEPWVLPGGIRRASSTPRSGTFWTLLPAELAEAAAEVVLLAAPGTPERLARGRPFEAAEAAASGGAVVLARFVLD